MQQRFLQMRIISFKTPKPKRFNYKPRYFDPEKEALERRKAEMGVESNLTHKEELKLQMSRRWGKNYAEEEKSILSRVVTYLIYAVFIGGSIYLILFTNIIENMLKAFGVTN